MKVPPREATILAMRQVSGPVIAVALVLSAVFVPCAFITGITGQDGRYLSEFLAAKNYQVFGLLHFVEPVIVRAPRPRCADGHGTLTHLFFSDTPLDIARAKAICSKCSLAVDCVSGAIERAEPWGVWGGELIENGRIVVNKRPRGRPPKNPRPVVAIDEVPIPPHLVA